MQTVWLEFRRENSTQLAALGTDTTFYIDGRWSWATTVEKIHDRLFGLREGHYGGNYRDLLFVGITYSQHPFHSGKGGAVHTMKDPNPPEWARKQAEDAAQDDRSRVR